MNHHDHAQPNKPLLSIEPLGGRSFRLVGEMDLSNSCWVGAALDGHVTTPGDLTLDLAGLEFMDSSGGRALARLARKLGSGYRLIARNPGDAVERVISSGTFRSVPNLVIDREVGAEAGAPGASALQPEMGLKGRMWGVLGLAQSLIPMADEVSFTVRQGPRLTTPVATGADAADCDSAQYQLNDGPCVRAAREGSTELFAIAEAEHLRPFLETARDRGINAVLSIPVLAEPSKPVGALNLYSRAPGAFPSVEIPHAQVLAIRAARLFTAPDA